MKVKALLVSLLVLFSCTFGGVSGNMQNFFNNMGMTANVTGSHAYQGQEAGYYTAGNLFVRAQNQDIQIAHVDVPSITAGCGGINMFMGSFSFINSATLIQAGKNIISAAPAYAFQLAMETYAPQVTQVMSKLQEWANFINNLAVNSCQASQALVAGLWPKNTQAQQYMCRDLASQSNVFSDWAGGMQGCADSKTANSQLNKASNDPKYKERVTRNINVVWDAIRKNQFLASDNELSEMFMTLVGTIVFDNNGQPSFYPANINDGGLIKALLNGGDANIYHCSDSSKCLSINTSSKVSIEPDKALRSMVRAQIQGIYDSYKSDTALTDAQKSFLNSVSLPVFKLIAVSYQTGASSRIDTYADIIAQDILVQYLNSILQLVTYSLANSGVDQDVIKGLKNSIATAQMQVDNLDKIAYSKVTAYNSIIQQSLVLEQKAAGLASAQTKENLTFGA